jgi:hypothetical protein
MPISKSEFTIKRNDTLPALQATLVDVNCLGGKLPFNLSAVTAVTFTMVDSCGNAKVLLQPAQIISASGGILQYNWQVGDTDTEGVYDGEFQMFFSGGGKMSVPRDTPISIEIFKDINPY